MVVYSCYVDMDVYMHICVYSSTFQTYFLKPFQTLHSIAYYIHSITFPNTHSITPRFPSITSHSRHSSIHPHLQFHTHTRFHTHLTLHTHTLSTSPPSNSYSHSSSTPLTFNFTTCKFILIFTLSPSHSPST